MEKSRLAFDALPLLEFATQYRNLFPLEDPGRAATELATSLSNSPPLRHIDHVVAVRNSPASLIIVTDREDRPVSQLHSLNEQIQSTLDRTRYVSWSAIEEASEATAGRLVETLGNSYLERALFRAIPRGGHIALGLLSYQLGVSADQISDHGDADGPMIVVDDCALTGLRFKEAISSIPNREIVFVTLFSPPALREAIAEAEPSVAGCIGGVDLTDHAKAMPLPEREAWISRWRERGEVYWTGQPDHLVFPWGETEVGVWNPATEAVEPGWRIGPPSLCMANGTGVEPDRRRVQVMNPGSGALKLSPQVLYAWIEGDVAVFDLSSSTVWNLEGTAAEMWRTLLENPSIPIAAQEFAQRWDVEIETVADDMRAFVGELIDEGLFVDTSTR